MGLLILPVFGLSLAYQPLTGPRWLTSLSTRCFTFYTCYPHRRCSPSRSYTRLDVELLRSPRTAAISYLSPLLAVIVGILHASLSPVIVIGGVKPNLVLVAVVLVTAIIGFLPGITWAFVAGLTANLLVGEPLGSVPLTMLLVAVLTAGGGRMLGRMVWIYPVLAAFAGSIVADVASLGISQLVSDASIVGIPTGVILGAALLNAAIAALLVYPMRAAMSRWAVDELPAW
ncbi:MAG TPA: rod shape-determining protein MreD [Candidatus Limnocylindria bacterium]|nr:rod shape-determining protein MreD [Candidatus Limnocylindria bacterium]